MEQAKVHAHDLEMNNTRLDSEEVPLSAYKRQEQENRKRKANDTEATANENAEHLK